METQCGNQIEVGSDTILIVNFNTKTWLQSMTMRHSLEALEQLLLLQLILHKEHLIHQERMARQKFRVMSYS
jgi:hypothetical protein